MLVSDFLRHPMSWSSQADGFDSDVDGFSSVQGTSGEPEGFENSAGRSCPAEGFSVPSDVVSKAADGFDSKV